MNSNNSNALVPLKNGNLPAVVNKKRELPTLSLVREELYLADRQAVREQLPDILGRVLARIWIDEKFHHDFSMNPRGTLETNGVFLPETMDVEFQNIARSYNWKLWDKQFLETNNPHLVCSLQRNFEFKFVHKNYETSLVFVKF